MNTLNFAEERYLFVKIWLEDKRRYIEAGMGKPEIDAMYEFHKEQFNSDRRYRLHNTVQLEGAVFPDGGDIREDQSPLLEKYYERITVFQPEISDWGRYEWIEDLETPELAVYIKSLPDTVVELLTGMVVDGMSRADLSRAMGVSRTAVSKRTKNIEKALKEILPEG